MHKYAVIISARDESRVIGELLDSLRSQNYPEELLDIFVVADNCTDETAEVARRYGVVVFERNNKQKIGKGYALNYAFERINELYGIKYYAGYLVFDADNILDKNYIKEINSVFDSGYNVVTSYRNSKNFGYNWISAGYSLWFLRESKYLNGARMICNVSCAISGTGFLVSSDIIEKDGGWKYSLLTEDIEFTADKVINKEVIGYCESAILYDEQPINFKTSWDQRMRWAKGFYQVVHNYGFRLLRGCCYDRSFQCFDILATVAPANLLSILVLLINILAMFLSLTSGNYHVFTVALSEIGKGALNIYFSLLFCGLVTVITEWEKIHCSRFKKVLYLFTFPIFMFTYLPISIVALFKKVTWKPIPHTFVRTLQNSENEAFEKNSIYQ